jgi:asparagine synthase (glutamine-hydrolysing)
VTPESRLRAFTADYARVPTSSEAGRAQIAADALGIPMTPVPADRHAALHHISEGRPTPQPVDEPALSDWRALIGAAATHGRAALYGEDGDALFRSPDWQELRRAIPPISLAGDIARFMLATHRPPYLGFRLRERAGLSKPPALPPPPRWLHPGSAGGSADATEPEVLGHRAVPLQAHATRPQVQERLWPAVSAYLAGILSPELTGHRLELRCPLLDTRVIRFVVNVAPIPWCQQKELARSAYADVLPPAITRRPKQGVVGLDEAVARDWQRHHARDTEVTPLPPPLDGWIAADEWRRALRSPDPRIVAEAWRVLQLIGWMTGRGDAVSLRNVPCTA